MKAVHKLLSVSVICASLSASFICPASAQMELGIINQRGDVWAHDLTTTTIGPGVKLTGDPVVGSNDEFVLGKINEIGVVNKSGELWLHTVTDESVFPGYRVPGSLFGGPIPARYVVWDGGRLIYVINTIGDVWAHYWTRDGVSGGYKLKGRPIVGPNDKYVVWEAGYTYGGRILVVNRQGEVWAHELSCSIPPVPPSFSCTIDTVAAGYKLNGPSLFGAPNDKYVAIANDLLMVINTSGEVWAHTISYRAVGPGYRLNGLKVFGGNDDRFVVVYEVVPVS